MSVRPRPLAGHPCRRAIALTILVLAWLAPVAGAQCPGSGSCCEANGTPGCSLESCCFDICLFFDPTCCSVEWDQGCVDLAAILCPFCADPPTCPGEGDCFDANGSPGCDDEICCTEVCVIDATCCDVEWDEMCATLALDACDAPCIDCPDGALAENEPGCVFLPSVIPWTAAEIVDGFAAGDRFGHSVALIGDVDGDLHDDYIIGAYLKTVGGVTQRGRVYVFSGVDGELLWSQAGEAQGDQFGFSVGAAGDVNNDGIPDVVVGARRNDHGGANAGRVYAYNGINGASFWEFDGPAAGDEVGSSVDGIGDVNGDGRSDVAVSSFLKASERGRVWVLSGLDATIIHAVTGDAPGDRLGFDVAGLGDVNGDGVPDFGAGAYQADLNGDNAGLAFAYSGVDASPLLVFADGLAGDEFGFAIAGAGDVDGDGFDDVVVGARLADAGTGNPDDNRGQAFVYSSKTATLLHTLTGDAPGDEFGFDVAGIGDADGDGLGDVIVGAPKAGSGTAHAFSGASGEGLYTLEGDDVGDDFGYAVDGGGDVDASGATDVLIGARLNDVVAVDAGRGYLFLDLDGTPTDAFNGGCFSTPTAVSPIGCNQSVCGTSGYDPATGAIDTDWYEFTVAVQSIVTWTVTAEFAVEAGMINPAASNFCATFNELEFIESDTGPACSAVTIQRSLSPGTWWLYVAPDPIASVDCALGYVGTLSCQPDFSEPECGNPGAGSCLIANGTPYCDDLNCCELICGVDPMCCNIDWDGFCAEQADAICAISPNCPGAGDCFVAGTGPGCDDTTCCNVVCAADPFCCDVVWDAICAAEAQDLCGEGCTVECPPGATMEVEPDCGLDGFGNADDTVNGGCNAEPPVFGEIACGETVCGTAAYNANSGNRDTDWYAITLDQNTEVTWTVVADFPVVAAIVDSGGTPDCPARIQFLGSASVGPCVEATVTRCLGPGTWWLFVAPEFIVGVPCGTPYTATVSCSTPCDPLACGDPGAGDCLVANATPYCDDEACCDLVCAIDPFCCNDTWDDVCASEAKAQCDLDPVENDECETALELLDGDTPFTTVGATIGGLLLPPNCSGSKVNQLFGPDVWYRYTPTCAGTLTVETCQQADFDSGIAIYSGACGGLALVDCNDDALGCGITSRVTATVDCGTEYFIRVYGSQPDDIGSGTVTVTCDGDSCGGCPEDLTGDGSIDGADLGLLLGSWGACPGCPEDLTGDGQVDGADLGLLLGSWGMCP